MFCTRIFAILEVHKEEKMLLFTPETILNMCEIKDVANICETGIH